MIINLGLAGGFPNALPLPRTAIEKNTSVRATSVGCWETGSSVLSEVVLLVSAVTVHRLHLLYIKGYAHVTFRRSGRVRAMDISGSRVYLCPGSARIPGIPSARTRPGGSRCTRGTHLHARGECRSHNQAITEYVHQTFFRHYRQRWLAIAMDGSAVSTATVFRDCVLVGVVLCTKTPP